MKVISYSLNKKAARNLPSGTGIAPLPGDSYPGVRVNRITVGCERF